MARDQSRDVLEPGGALKGLSYSDKGIITFDLGIVSSHKHQRSIMALPNQVSSFVESPTLCVGIASWRPSCTRNEGLKSCIILPKIAPCQGWALNKKFSDATNWNETVVVGWIDYPQMTTGCSTDMVWGSARCDMRIDDCSY